jgi:hypothetical protein
MPATGSKIKTITIYQAATDGKDQLRYVIGDNARFYIDGKFNNSDQDYIKLMRNYFNYSGSKKCLYGESYGFHTSIHTLRGL